VAEAIGNWAVAAPGPEKDSHVEVTHKSGKGPAILQKHVPLMKRRLIPDVHSLAPYFYSHMFPTAHSDQVLAAGLTRELRHTIETKTSAYPSHVISRCEVEQVGSACGKCQLVERHPALLLNAGQAALPHPTVNDASEGESCGHQGDMSGGYSFEFSDELQGVWRELIEATRLSIVNVDVINERKRDVGWPV